MSNYNRKLATYSLTIAGFFTYLHFLGRAYLRGRIEGYGFRNTIIEISPQESMHQIGLLFTFALSDIKAISIIFWEALPDILETSFIISILSILLYLAYLALRYTRSSARDLTLRLKSSLVYSSQKDGTLLRKYGLPILAVLSAPFVVITGAQLVVLAVIIFAFLFIWLVLMMCYIAGFEQSWSEIDGGVCRPVVFEENKGPKHSCSRLYAIDDAGERKTLVGIKAFKDDQTLYFVTNEGAYELGQNRQIIFTKLIRPNPVL